MRFLIIFLLIGGCKTASPVVSEPEFMTFLQDDPHRWSQAERNGTIERLLVAKIHEKSWDIDYGFAPTCSKSRRKKLRPNIVEAIRRAVNLWLQPIKEIQRHYTTKASRMPELNIREREPLSGILYGKQKLYMTFDIRKNWGKLNKEKPDHKDIEFLLNLPELSVVFNCNKGRPWMQHRYNSINIYETVHESAFTTRMNIPKTKFSFGHLLHEVGHTFGLADTYVDPSDKFRDHMISTDANPYTVGHQPFSVMSVHQYLDFSTYDDVKLTIDDRQGIFWLYTYMHINKLKLSICPSSYQPEFFARKEKDYPRTVACRPKQPFLFALKYSLYSTARVLLFNKKSSIDINARNDKRGFTALHYAVFTTIELLKAILERFHKEIDFNIAGSDANMRILKGKPPMTALQLAQYSLGLAHKIGDKPLIKHFSESTKLLLKYTEGGSR